MFLQVPWQQKETKISTYTCPLPCMAAPHYQCLSSHQRETQISHTLPPLCFSISGSWWLPLWSVTTEPLIYPYSHEHGSLPLGVLAYCEFRQCAMWGPVTWQLWGHTISFTASTTFCVVNITVWPFNRCVFIIVILICISPSVDIWEGTCLNYLFTYVFERRWCRLPHGLFSELQRVRPLFIVVRIF